jgi:hypothetical protein
MRTKQISTLGLSVLLCACNAALDIKVPRDGADSSTDKSPVVSTFGDGGIRSVEAEDGGEELDAEPPTPPAEPSPYAWAAWPMPNPPGTPDVRNPQKFIMPGALVVTDSITKLSWQQSAENGPYTREEAEKYCSTLELKGGGFRLPSRIELLSLVDLTQTSPALDPKAFPDSPTGRYWSSSRYALDAELGWVVDFDFNTSLLQIQPAGDEYLVRCVR